MKLSTDSQRRRKIEGASRVSLLGTLPEEEWEVHHQDHENKAGCGMDRVDFLKEVWTVMQCYGTQSMLKIGIERRLMQENHDKLDECERRMSELLIESATDESESNSPIKMTHQESNEEVGYLYRIQKGTMRSKMVIDNINGMKMKLGSKVILNKTGKTKTKTKTTNF